MQPLQLLARHAQSYQQSCRCKAGVVALTITLHAGKKWFLKPSLSTQQGQAITGVVNYNTKKYVSVKLLATCSMRMETAAILMLRKVLNPDFPLHQAIIYQSQAPEEQEDSTDQNIPPIAVSSELTSNRAVKRERTASSPSANRRVIKREPRGVFSRSCDAEEDGCIDLT